MASLVPKAPSVRTMPVRRGAPAVARPRTPLHAALIQGGAPRKPIDMGVLRRAAALCCTADEIAALLGIGRRTFFGAMERDPS
jgi:hypothetical protein